LKGERFSEFIQRCGAPSFTCGGVCVDTLDIHRGFQKPFWGRGRWDISHRDSTAFQFTRLFSWEQWGHTPHVHCNGLFFSDSGRPEQWKWGFKSYTNWVFYSRLCDTLTLTFNVLTYALSFSFFNRLNIGLAG
jgi:hypothetical protein